MSTCVRRSSYLSRLFESLRLQRDLKPGQLAALLGAIDGILGVELFLEWTDLRVLFRSELELELQPISVTTSPNDESSGEGVETELGNLVNGSFAIKVN